MVPLVNGGKWGAKSSVRSLTGFRMLALAVTFAIACGISFGFAAVDELPNSSSEQEIITDTASQEGEASWFVNWLTRVRAEWRERTAERLAKRYLEALERDGSRPEDAHKRHLVEIESIPFLIPDGYFESRVRDDPLVLPELSIHASLPDIGADGATVEPPPGFGDYLMIGMHPPARYTDMNRELVFVPPLVEPLHTEIQFESALSMKVRLNQTGSDLEQAASDFLRRNRLSAGEVLEISYFFFSYSPERDSKRYFVVFSESRLVLRMRCDNPAPGTYPSCWVNAHFPNYPFSLTLIFDASYRDEAYLIAQRVYAMFDKFNAAAIDQLGGAAKFRHGDLDD